MTLDEQFGPIDIYLFDQILRRRIAPGDRIVDAGCGMGRNLVYLLREGYDVHGADADPDAIAEVRALAARLAPSLPPENFRVEPLEQLSFPERSASVVISSAVLHFARDDAQFEAMLAGSWRVLASGGMFFCRLASTIGIESQVERLGSEGRRYRLPDGTVFGIISSTTQPFCQDCDRSRLTADGMWYLCLYASRGVDLRGALRRGATPVELAEVIRAAWEGRRDRGAEDRLAARDRAPLIPIDTLRRDPHLEMHTRGG